MPDRATDHQRVNEYLSNGELATLLRRSLKYVFRPRPKVRIAHELPAGKPLVSVVIPTYNRSNVLRIAIQSVLWQTEQNFELLVVGDGCTDDSESVVKSFGDARIFWKNLPTNTGHQSAPNNAALALASGRYIAFLCHDDIWHPDHLRTLLDTMKRKQADIVLSVIEMMGPRRSNYRVITGLYPNGGHDPVTCVPHSGLMYLRDVYDRVGPLQDFRTVWRNPECEFQYQAHLAGFRFASSGEMTSFMFHSTLWKNSYIEKPCQEQDIYRNRIQKSRWFQVKEALDIAWVHFRRLPMQEPAIPPPPEPHALGWTISHYRKFRGLEKETE